jgi:putative glutamine amidotransferase
MDAAGGWPMIIPSLPATVPPETVFNLVDGILFTGSHSNIEPHHYAGPAALDDTKFDPQRDATTLPMIRSAVDRGIPILGICRGFQEMNVAYGGSLHQRVHELDGFNDHREPEGEPDTVQYGPAHEIEFSPHGQLVELMGGDAQATVNSLHWQGIDRLGEGLTVEARAGDGLVEAFSVTGAQTFALAVQWHPEWRAMENALSSALFRTFGDACRQRANKRR